MPLEIVDDQSESEFARAQTGLLFNLPAPPPEQPQPPAGISLCMIVKNEERFLAECLASVRDVVDEINVVDTGSTDRTIEIARSFGANVTFREWRNDFGWARNESLAMAKRRWTLVLDADEELARESATLLRALRETPAGLTGVYVHIQNLIDDVSGAASTMTHMLPRVFPNTPRIRYKNVIHESLVVDGERHLHAALSPVLIRHKGYTAEIMDARGKNVRNAPLLERALKEAAGDAFSWFNFGTAAVAAGDYETGIDVLERMFAMPGPRRMFFPVAYVMLAHAYADGRNDLERAMETIDKAIEEAPGHANVIFTRAHLLSKLERYEEAREECERAMAARSSAANHAMVDDEIFTWKSQLNIASTYVREERLDEAVPWFERAYQGKPDSTLLRGLLANAYEKVGRFYDAERLFREGAELAAPEGFVEYVNYLMRRRRFAEAFDRVEHNRALVSDAAYAELLLSAAGASRDERLGDPEPYALRALDLQPGNGAALSLLQALYDARGETEKSARLRADELHAPLCAAADFARRSHRLLEEGRLEDAFETARAGLEVAPHDAVLSYNAGLAAARLRRDGEAIALLDEVDASDAHAATALALRAEIERRAGDLDGAVATLRRLRALPEPDVAILRHAVVGLASALLEAGRIAEAGKLAELALN
ncbi:MAG TPA: tetratricopeptide repeat protein [Candidatus Elarobacter sp.]|nr:tetratricopeptide repeat protein [Candidatus Elarobacter sp.]